jgi:Cu2+-exporting ATPase
VQQVISVNEKYLANDILQNAAALQQYSEHYISKGILRELDENNLQLWNSQNFKYEPGVGVSGEVNGKSVFAGGPNYFARHNKPLPAIPESINQQIETLTFVLIDNEVAGIITLADSIRETSANAIAELKKMNIKSFLVTGDNENIASSVSEKLGMDGYMANVLPHQKQERVKELQSKGEIVAMTGDGVNDAPALAKADVGIAVGSGTDVAAETADIILVNSDPKDVVNMIAFGRATYNKMLQNLGWAVGYNVIAIPLAAGVLYPHFMLSPAMGAILMSLSTVIVAINAKMLKVKTK